MPQEEQIVGTITYCESLKDMPHEEQTVSCDYYIL
jgi:hypothetical protein